MTKYILLDRNRLTTWWLKEWNDFVTELKSVNTYILLVNYIFVKKTVILYKNLYCWRFVDGSILTKLQFFTNFRTLSKIEGFERIGSFENSSLPNWYIDGKEPVAQAGTQQGLTIILDAHSNILSRFSVVDDFEGFEGIVKPQGYHIFLCFVVCLS